MVNKIVKSNLIPLNLGVLLGFLFLVGGIVVLVIYHVLDGKKEELVAAITFCAVDLAQVNFLLKLEYS